MKHFFNGGVFSLKDAHFCSVKIFWPTCAKNATGSQCMLWYTLTTCSSWAGTLTPEFFFNVYIFKRQRMSSRGE